MKYDVIKSTDQLMGIWGLGNIKQGEETKMTVSTDNDEAFKEGDRVELIDHSEAHVAPTTGSARKET
jgi:hypothetical protein